MPSSNTDFTRQRRQVRHELANILTAVDEIALGLDELSPLEVSELLIAVSRKLNRVILALDRSTLGIGASEL